MEAYPSPETQKPRIDTVPDILDYRTSVIDRPDQAYYIPLNNAYDNIRDIEEGADSAATATLITDFGYNLELSRRILTAPQYPLNPSDVHDPFGYEQMERAEHHLAGQGLTVASFKERVHSYSDDQILEHFTAKLENLTTTFTRPGDGSRQAHPSEYLDIAHSLYAAVRVVPETDAQKQAWTDRYNRAISNLSTMLLSHNKVGMAIAFGNLNQSVGWTESFIPQLTDELRRLRQVEGDDSYRRVYNYATSILRGEQLQSFLGHLPKEQTPLIPGSVATFDKTSGYLFERFAESDDFAAQTASGQQVTLPYIAQRSRTIFGYGTNREREIYELQNGVAYEQLDEQQKAAIEIAIRIQDEDLMQMPPLPACKRLGLKPGEEGAPATVHTIINTDDREHRLFVYPDNNFFSTDDSPRFLDKAVEAIETVADGYVACPYDGGYMMQASYRHSEINFFMPPEGDANAFWVSGNARTVYSETNDRISPLDEKYGHRNPKFILFPVRFYKVEEKHEDEQPRSLGGPAVKAMMR